MLVAKKRKRPQPTDWAARLKALRERLGLTQAAAADRASVALRTWISWENGHRTPGRLTQILLSQAFPGQF